jgi:hypothetical protein
MRTGRGAVVGGVGEDGVRPRKQEDRDDDEEIIEAAVSNMPSMRRAEVWSPPNRQVK